MPLAPRARRRWLILAAFALLIGFAAWWVDHQLEPARLTRTVLERAGAALQLDLRAGGEPDYALRPEPRLRLPDFSARTLDGKLLLSAKRLEVSLPWATLTGGEPIITRIELDSARLDLGVLQGWLDTRPPEPFKIPTLSRGLHLRDGLLIGDGWRVSHLALDLPRLAPDRRAQFPLTGRFLYGDSSVSFNTRVDIARAGQRSDFSLRADLALARTPEPLRASITTQGRYALDATPKTLVLPALSVRADSPLPSFAGNAAFASGKSLAANATVRLVEWPEAWPKLPGTLAGKGAGLPVKLTYRGGPALDGPLTVHAEREGTVLDASLRAPELAKWIDDRNASPLPPLVGTLRTPTLELDGMRMEGVELQMLPDDAPAGGPDDMPSAPTAPATP